jgi:predicted phage terminase large subunit-like protein
LLDSETYSQSSSLLKAIKNHIENNDVLKAIFGDLRPTDMDSSWRADEITIAGRSVVRREASVMTSGVEQVKTGFHFDLIIMDDCVSEKSVNTPEQIQKTIDHYRLILSILEPGAELVICGTRYFFSDLYGHLLEEESDTFSIHKRSAIQEDGSLLFPTRLTRKFLDEQKRAQGSAMFSNQYQNECTDQDSAIFKTAWLQYYKSAPQNLRKFIMLDPASGNSKNTDANGIIVAGIDCDSNIYVLEAIADRSTIADLMNVIFDLVKKYNVQEEGCLGIETAAMQQTLKFIFTQEMNKRNFYFTIKELKPHTTKSKVNRVRALQPYFENGKIFLSKEHHQLIEQIIRFPKMKHDDLIDSLAYILEIMAPADPSEIDKWKNSTLPYNHLMIWKALDEKRNAPRYVKRRKL